MGAFEFFFSFYGLLLGFSVAELVGGFARAIHERRAVRFGVLTPLLAVFVAIDIATFWNQAWLVFRFAPFNFSLLILGLVVASIFYVAATLVFPRDFQEGTDLEPHFWAHRRMILLSVLAANLIMFTLFIGLAAATGELAQMRLPPMFWWGGLLFMLGTLAAALLKGRRVVTAVLVVLVAYSGFNVARAAMRLVDQGGWSMLKPPAE